MSGASAQKEVVHTPAAPTPLQSVIAGSSGGLASTLVVHPMDTIRTRLQTSNKFHGAADCFRATVHNEGFLALYKGMAVPLAAQGVYKAVMFSAYNGAQSVLRPYTSSGNGPLPLSLLFLSGAFAGGVNATIVSPVELVRNRLMTQYHRVAGQAASNAAREYTGPVDAIRKIIATEGVRGMWKGLSSTLGRDMPGLGAYYALFELSQRVLARATAPPGHTGPHRNYHTARVLTSGALAGIGFWAVALPFDVIKSRIQTNHAGEPSRILQVAADVMRERGVLGFYRGWSVAFTRGIPSAAITFYSYTTVMHWLQHQ